MISNYLPYRRLRISDGHLKLNPVQEALECYPVVDGSEIRPSGQNREKEVMEWDKRDGKACRILTCGLNDDDHTAIRDCTSAHQIWLKIKSMYEQRTSENKYLLQQEFFKLKFEDSETVSSYCAKLLVLSQKLKTVGEEVTDTALVSKM